jgi:hypothetical protein
MIVMPPARNERTVGLFLSVLKAAWAGAAVRTEAEKAPSAERTTEREPTILGLCLRLQESMDMRGGWDE